MRLQGKVALVTGGNSGIGRGIVHRFVEEGAAVAFAGRDRDKGEAVLGEVGGADGKCSFFAVDLASESAVSDFVAAVGERYGRLDIVINNAGVGARRGGIEAGDPPGVRWDKMRGPNVDAAYFVAASAMPMLAAAGNGAIVNVSSTATLHGNWGLYCVAKAAVEGLTRAQAAEGAPHGIRANCISPGWIAIGRAMEAEVSASDDGSWSMPPSLLKRMGTPAEIASVALFLATDESAFVTGQTIIVDGGMSLIDYPSMPMLADSGGKLFSGKV